MGVTWNVIQTNLVLQKCLFNQNHITWSWGPVFCSSCSSVFPGRSKWTEMEKTWSSWDTSPYYLVDHRSQPNSNWVSRVHLLSHGFVATVALSVQWLIGAETEVDRSLEDLWPFVEWTFSMIHYVCYLTAKTFPERSLHQLGWSSTCGYMAFHTLTVKTYTSE